MTKYLMIKNFFTFSRFTLFVALCISAIAAWYSVLGLTAIFAAAVIPIVIMGGILEIAKITTTVWLHRYWHLASRAIKTYLTVAVIALALLTSMGIFGFLSKAHLDQAVPTGDVAAKLALYDEKIKTERDNIDSYRQALKQMDDQVEQRLSRGTSEQGAERAVQIRRQQAGERAKLQREIGEAQQKIAKLNEDRAPIASQLRKVEAEVGPIKYVAALIYGDNPDATTLERAVRWVIIMIVVVFDPLAIVLILAANNSLKWEKEAYLQSMKEPEIVEKKIEEEIVQSSEIDTSLIDEDATAMKIVPPEEIKEIELRNFTEEEIKLLDTQVPTSMVETNKDAFNQSNYDVKYTILKPEFNLELPVKEEMTQVDDSDRNDAIAAAENSTSWPHEWEESEETLAVKEYNELKTEGVTTEAKLKTEGVYVMHEGKNTSLEALKHLRPELLNSLIKNEILFGTEFPKVARSGDIYTRVDVIPHRTYKFNGVKWIQMDRNNNTSYLQNSAYIQLLIQKIDMGEYDPEFLTEHEQDEISNYLAKTV